ncbi:small CPxCG-related zinc finger protein [Halobacterium hubeiense]|uniref:Small CPxCG-related zinc finger protein n=1 Tax=Halobacterium hubeiense TaxID=1407499 RepID=A0A0U5H0C1_9EURY|nr:hypothetical protein [Halobacterium hubeiense]CQH56422.1 small CPxCG-related zinc finger protein [Halobacterium hubeiense]
MAKPTPADDAIREQCTTCEKTRPHDVTIELLTESGKDTNRKFFREPYHIAECRNCGTTTKLRLNNA